MKGIEVIGLNEALKNLQNKSKDIKKKVNEAIHQSGFIVEAEVKESIAGRRSEPTSVDTGRFLNSVRTDNAKEFESTVSSDLEYSKYLEYGTSRMGARHHFQNSANRKKSDVISKVTTAIK